MSTLIGKNLLNKISGINNENKNFIINIIIIIVFVVVVRVTPNEIKIINNLFINLNNSINYPLFKEKIKKSYKLKSTPKLLYVSKDYAFFESDKKIIVVNSTSITEINEK